MGNSQTTVAAAGVDDIEASKENLCGCIPAIFGPINNPMLVAPPESETGEACDGDPQSATQNAFPRCPSPAETFQESLDSNSNREALNIEPSSSVKSQAAKPSTVENVVEKIDRTIEHSVAHAEKIEVSVPSAKSSEERETPDMIEIVHDANEAEAPAIAVVSSEEKTEENKLLEGLNTAHDLQAEVSAEVKKEPPVESVSDVVEASTLAAVSLEEKTEENKVLKGIDILRAAASAEVQNEPSAEGVSAVNGTTANGDALPLQEKGANSNDTIASAAKAKRKSKNKKKKRKKSVKSAAGAENLATAFHDEEPKRQEIVSTPEDKGTVDGKKPRNCFCCNKEEEQFGKYKECAKCHVAVYCSRECQVKDWKMHKKVCCKTISI